MGMSPKQRREHKLEQDIARLKRQNADLTRDWLQQTGENAKLEERLSTASDVDGGVARELVKVLLAALRSRLHPTSSRHGTGDQVGCGCDGCTAVRMAGEFGYSKEEQSDGAKARNGG